MPKEPVFRMIASMPAGVRTAFYEQGYHLLLRDLHADRPWSDIVAWIGDHGAALPSGSDRRQPRELAWVGSLEPTSSQ